MIPADKNREVQDEINQAYPYLEKCWDLGFRIPLLT